VCVRLPSDSPSRKTPLSFANSSYCQVCNGLSPPSYYPCRAHHEKAINLALMTDRGKPHEYHSMIGPLYLIE
ncbi:hypothetical protein, partial [Halolactibacillus alkaliphilus]|uniref:hypothetical protein n=1 Tax=Halolactibacillus alkaliphilus TaxID=442899 RepID=UPI001E2BFBB9